VSVAASAEGSDLPAKASLVRAELPIAERVRFDAELDGALDTARQTHDLRPLAGLVEAWYRMVLIRRHAGPGWAETEARLRGGQGPTWDGEPAEVEEFIRRTLA
jgi:hypothetical protein